MAGASPVEFESAVAVTLFATDAALAWRAKKRSTTLPMQIKVDSNFSCEYDADGFFAGMSRRAKAVSLLKLALQIPNTAISITCVRLAGTRCCNAPVAFGIRTKAKDANGRQPRTVGGPVVSTV